MSFKEACAKAAIKAGETGVQFFVYDAPTTWDVTASFRPGWLFRAYPGGRKVLSVEGTKLLQEDELPNANRWAAVGGPER